MKLDFAMLARAVHVSNGEFFIHGGHLTILDLPTLPTATQVGFAAAWSADMAERGDTHKLQVRIYPPGSDAPILNIPPITFTLEPTGTDFAPDDEPQIALVLAVNLGIGFSTQGRHRVELLLDDDKIAELSLRIRVGLPPTAVDPVGFRKAGNRVELRGIAGGGSGAGHVAVFQLPEGHRPSTEERFETESERGTTTVIVMPNGSVLADPSAGWVSFNGISFTVDDESA